MKITGEKHIEASREKVWDLLQDPAVLGRCLPGCESVERTGADGFVARLALKLGPIRTRINGHVSLQDKVPPESCTVVGRGDGGLAGSAEGRAAIRLEAQSPDRTVLHYAMEPRIGGRLAQFGGRLIESGMRKFADRFFTRFAQVASRKAGKR